MKAFISRNLSAFFTSRGLRNARRRFNALKRRLRGGQPVIHYFHQVDDPYSHLAVQMLKPLGERYGVEEPRGDVDERDRRGAPERQK